MKRREVCNATRQLNKISLFHWKRMFPIVCWSLHMQWPEVLPSMKLHIWQLFCFAWNASCFEFITKRVRMLHWWNRRRNIAALQKESANCSVLRFLCPTHKRKRSLCNVLYFVKTQSSQKTKQTQAVFCLSTFLRRQGEKNEERERIIEKRARESTFVETMCSPFSAIEANRLGCLFLTKIKWRKTLSRIQT